jgi:very-short-patch-repair endonuclease/DNA polymerase III delta prime subunit
MPVFMSIDTVARLEISRKELLDLGLRNPLINHRSRAKQVKVVDELSTEVYRILVTDGRAMSFDPLPDTKAKELAEREAEDGGEADAVNWEDLLAQPVKELVDGRLADRHIDNRLQTNLVSEKLQTRLLSIHNDARTYLEEQGVNILYLALGFLHWYEASSAKEARRAPLLLIPVSLARSNAQERFQLIYTSEDIGDNISLHEKLKAEFNIELPTIESGEELDVNSYMSAVATAVKDDNRWHVDANEITLGFFSFGKLLMYKDLDAQAWAEEARGQGFSILDALLINGFKEAESQYGDETHIDEVISPADVHQVKDADSTQILAILDVNAGRNLVLQGPPGTGKSQTITNIIAECIGNGKKVLFVSEKMAALDVVKRRLDEVGLGDAVMELHSHKTNKKQVLSELNRTLNLGRPVVGYPEDDIETLTRLRDELNEYCHAINKPIGNTRTSFINALGFALKKHNPHIEVPPFSFIHMARWSELDYRAARMEVEKLDRHIAEAGAPSANPFKVSRLTEFLPSQRPRLEIVLDTGVSDTQALRAVAIELAQCMGLETPAHRSEAEVICRAARRAMDAPHLDGLALSSGEWQERRDDLASLFASGRVLSQAHASYDEWLIDEAWQQDLLDVRQQYVIMGPKWWRFLSGDFRRAKAKLQGLCRKPLPKDISKTIEMIDTILDSQKHQKQYNHLSQLGAKLFGAQWKKTESDWNVLEKLIEWVVRLYRDVGDGVVPEGILNFLSGSPKLDALKDMVARLETQLQDHKKTIEQIEEILKLNLKEGTKVHWGITLEKQIVYLAYWRKSIDSIFHLVRFNQLAEELPRKGLDFVIPVSKDWRHTEGALVNLFDYSWYNGLVEMAYVETPSIKMFDRTHHSHILGEFSRLDHLLFRHNQARLAAKHWQSLPKLSGGGELHIINREINKKRKHMPIRRLMNEAGRAIQAIKPVFMMSPMSIATYVPPGSVQFDLVVFDEASQVKPVDAFGAIIRGNQTVVVGDSKQLPPTSFFDSLVDSADEEDFESVADMESILSLFLGKGAPERMLRWHYRSRHDSLIAVSNYEFYDSRLVVFPSPGVSTAASGLQFHHLEDTAYDRGKTRSNPTEAKAVARAVIEHAKTKPALTLGVVAFSTAQRDAIELQLELLRRADPSCEAFFNEGEREPFFVKNLENVQGDERDVIFISIGYGKTADGYMAMSFGPLNRDGGERRLNVLISRARLAMEVFSNFTDDDIDLNRTNARGVVALKHFLAYARTGILQQPYSTGKEPESPFEEVVIKALEQNGIEVEPQVGTAGFFIDIAVKDHENPGRYIMGIECDGATYHSSRSARDRDRLRQEVLEGLGWRLHRIWSTDWYRNPQQELERTLSAIEKAKLYYQSGILAQAPSFEKNAVVAPISRDIFAQYENESHSLSVPYKRAALRIDLGSSELHEIPAYQLLPSILQLVEQESPIHKIELIRRVTEGAGLKRSGSRIQAAIQSAIIQGVSERKLTQKGDFIWAPDMTVPPLRDRSELDATEKKFEFVAPEEIRLALYKAIEIGFSLSEEEAVSNAARLLGFHRVTSQAKIIFSNQVRLLIDEKEIEMRGGFLALTNN